MPAILVQLYPDIRAGRVYQYRLATCDITIDTLLPQLAPFLVSAAAPGPLCPASQAQVDPDMGCGWKQVYDGQGWVGGGWQRVACWSGVEGLRVCIAGAGEFLISASGHAIRRLSHAPAVDSVLFVEALMGPVLILALALQGVWCLHASAVRFGSQLAIFVGESGAGKSTLASYLHQQSETGWQRVADDILPVANSPHSGPGAWRQPPVALPHFPQLKLPPSAQMTNPRLEQIPIAAVYQLVDPTEEGKSVSLRQLAGREAISALLSHTMAARLMPPDLLQRHMDFCAGVSQVVSIWELSYPHLRSSLLEAQVLLAGQLAG